MTTEAKTKLEEYKKDTKFVEFFNTKKSGLDLDNESDFEAIKKIFEEYKNQPEPTNGSEGGSVEFIKDDEKTPEGKAPEDSLWERETYEFYKNKVGEDKISAPTYEGGVKFDIMGKDGKTNINYPEENKLIFTGPVHEAIIAHAIEKKCKGIKIGKETTPEAALKLRELAESSGLMVIFEKEEKESEKKETSEKRILDAKERLEKRTEKAGDYKEAKETLKESTKDGAKFKYNKEKREYEINVGLIDKEKHQKLEKALTDWAKFKNTGRS